MQTVQSYEALKTKAKQYQENAEQALVYFDEEVMERMQSTVNLIGIIEKNPQPAKLNTLKRNLMLENLQKVQAKEGVIREDIVAALGEGADFDKVKEKLMEIGVMDEYASENDYGDQSQEQISEENEGA